MYKKILILILMSIFLITSCGSSKLNDEEKKIVKEVEKEIKEFKKNPSKEKAQKLFEKRKIQNKKENYEIAKIYFESTSEYIPMSNYYIASYYLNDLYKNEKNYIKWEKKASDMGVIESSKNLALYYSKRGERNTAINYHMKVIKQGDKIWATLLLNEYFAGIKERKINKNKQEEVINFLKEEGTKDYEVREWLANLYEIEGNYTEAEKIYKNMSEENYEMAEYLLGNFYLKQKHYDEAEKWFLKGIEKHGRKFTLLFGLAEFYEEVEEYENAKEIYKEIQKTEKGEINIKATEELEKLKNKGI